MRTKSTGLKLRNLGNDAFSVETPPEHIKLHGIVLAVAKKQLFAHEYTHISVRARFNIIVVADTFDSKKKMMDDLN